jgi:hypothetical protein
MSKQRSLTTISDPNKKAPRTLVRMIIILCMVYSPILITIYYVALETRSEKSVSQTSIKNGRPPRTLTHRERRIQSDLASTAEIDSYANETRGKHLTPQELRTAYTIAFNRETAYLGIRAIRKPDPKGRWNIDAVEQLAIRVEGDAQAPLRKRIGMHDQNLDHYRVIAYRRALNRAAYPQDVTTLFGYLAKHPSAESIVTHKHSQDWYAQKARYRQDLTLALAELRSGYSYIEQVRLLKDTFLNRTSSEVEFFSSPSEIGSSQAEIARRVKTWLLGDARRTILRVRQMKGVHPALQDKLDRAVDFIVEFKLKPADIGTTSKELNSWLKRYNLDPYSPTLEIYHPVD